MGWSFRKSVGLGPFRINISKSGIGYSIGGAGFRTGVNSRGRRFRSFSIPGTGVHTINVTASPLPAITSRVLINGVGTTAAPGAPRRMT